MTQTNRGSIEFGLSLPNRAVLFGVPSESLIETAVNAEASGQFHSVWVGDNLLSKPRLEAIVLLSGIATRTKHLKLGTICMASFPLRKLIPFAIQWASLDILSNGQTILSVCLGGSAKTGPQFAAELKAMNVASADRVPILEEGVQLLRRFWDSGPVDFHGKIYEFENLEVLPKPIQEKIPIWIAVNPSASVKPEVEERALRRVARLADGWQTDGTPPEVFRSRWTRIREYSEEYGRLQEVNRSSLHLMVNINEDERKARQEAIEFLNHYYGEGAISDEKLESWLAFGPPSAVVDKIGQFIEAGCTNPVLRFTSWDQLGQLERCAHEVLPVFANMTAGSNS